MRPWLPACLLVAAACAGPGGTPSSGTAPETAAADPASLLPEAVSRILFEKWTGDLDGMMQRRLIRAGVVYSRTHYFIDRGVQRGIAYESLKLFEDQLNVSRKPGDKVHVVFVPLSRDQLLPALQDGRIDLVAAMLTVTPEREKSVAFTAPTRTNVSEIVVTGPGGPAVDAPEDLSGQTVFVRRSSSYYDSLVALNARLAAWRKAPVKLDLAPETLEDDDLLEMVNAGLVRAVVVDDYLAEFWSQVFPNLVVHPTAALRRDGRIAVAVRRGSPRLVAAANQWMAKNGPRTMVGNLLTQRYLKSTTFVTGATSAAERKRFEAVIALFRKYGARYDLDYLLMAAQGYQESRLDQSVRSRAGAIGVMQVLPGTGKDMNVGDIRQLEPNIHAGVKYIRYMIDEYFKDDPMGDDVKPFFAFASYNAGPARIRQLRSVAAGRGLDPNKWFNNVERIASERIGRETVQYVSNIFKYYVAYKLLEGRTEVGPLGSGKAPRGLP